MKLTKMITTTALTFAVSTSVFAACSADIDMGGKKITNAIMSDALGTSSEVANKNYVDAKIPGTNKLKTVALNGTTWVNTGMNFSKGAFTCYASSSSNDFPSAIWTVVGDSWSQSETVTRIASAAHFNTTEELEMRSSGTELQVRLSEGTRAIPNMRVYCVGI